MRRIERIRGRSDDTLIIRGVNVFPSLIEALLAQEKATPSAALRYWNMARQRYCRRLALS
jgi:phenylacetate-coenzyme A ligase PaaK-like adenylate-forming protein